MKEEEKEYLTSWVDREVWDGKKPTIMSSYYEEGDIVCRLNKGYILRSIFEPDMWCNNFDDWCERYWNDEYMEDWDIKDPNTGVIQPNHRWILILIYLMNNIEIDDLWVLLRLDENSPESFFHWEYRFKLEDNPMDFFDVSFFDLLPEIEISPEYKRYNRNNRIDSLLNDDLDWIDLGDDEE